MTQTFENSFSTSKVKETETRGRNRRPHLQDDSRIREVIQHYVNPSVRSTAQVQQSSNSKAVPGYNALNSNYAKTSTDRRDIKNILAMNPNAQLAIDISVNGTLSPNNTLDSQLQYKSSYDKLGPLKGNLLQKIRDVMEEYVELDETLPQILGDAKYYVGSYAMLVIPTGRMKQLIDKDKRKDKDTDKAVHLESVISNIAHVKSTNTYKPNTRYVTPSRIEIKMEDLGMRAGPRVKDKDAGDKEPIHGEFFVHSDAEVIRINQLRLKALADKDTDGVLDALENYSDYDPTEDLKEDTAKLEAAKAELLEKGVRLENFNGNDTVFNQLRRVDQFSQEEVITLEPYIDDEAVDIPYHGRIPHEAIFVIHHPGDVSKHLGYYIALDMSGNPVTVEPYLDTYTPNNGAGYNNGDIASQVGAQANYAGGNLELGFSGANTGFNANDTQSKSALFTKIMEERLLEKINSGVFKDSDLSLSEHRDLMHTMFSRYMSNKNTQLLFVPASLLTYIAFEHDDNGNGESLIIKHKNIGILNSTLTLANTLAAINNTIDYKEARITFDDDELDFSKVTEQITSNLARNSASNGQRMMHTDINRQFDYFGAKGLQFSFADHPAFPGTSVEITNLDRERTTVDSETVENNESKLIQALGSTPEVVDAARNVEFAASYFQSNLQAARRAIVDQKVLTKGLNKFVQIWLLNAPAIIKWMIVEIDRARSTMPEIRGIKTIDLVRGFIKSITTHLPKPDMVKVELLTKAIDAHEALVDKILQYTIGEDAILDMDVGENLTEVLESVRVKMKAMLMREFLASNNMYSDGIVAALFNNDEDEMESAMSRIEGNQQFVLNFLKKHEIISQTMIDKVTKDVEKIKEARDLGESTGGGGDFGGGDTDTGEDPNTDPDADTGEDPFGGEGGEVEDPDATTTDDDTDTGEGEAPNNPFG